MVTATERRQAKRPAGPKQLGELVDPEGMEERAKEDKPKRERKSKGGSRQKEAASAEPIKYRVQFGSVSIGDETCRLSMQVGREVLKVVKADELFCGRRINCTVIYHRADVDPDQQHFDGMDESESITAVCDVKGYSVRTKTISIGLTFARSEVSIERLANFAKQTGTLQIGDVRSLDEIEDEDE